MADKREVKVVLDADIDAYLRDLEVAAAATARLATQGDSVAAADRRTAAAERDLAGARKQGTAATTAATISTTQLAKGQQQAAATAKAASAATGALTKDQQQAAESAVRLMAGQNRLTDATERVVAAEKALAAARKASVGSTDERAAERVAAAESRLAKSRRDLQVVTASLDVVQSKAARSTDEMSVSMGRGQKVTQQTALTFGNLLLIGAAVGPAILPIGAAAGAAGLGLAGMGAAGILAVVGIKREMESGTAIGRRYSSGLVTMKGHLDTLSRTAADGVLTGFEQVVRDTSGQMPRLNQQVGMLSVTLGSTVASGLRGLLNLLDEAGPLMTSTALGAERMAREFEAWSKSDGARELLAYMRDSLPEVGSMLGELARAGVRLLQAFAPMGSTTVAALEAFASAINAIPLPVLTALITLGVQGGLAFKAWGAISGVLGKVGGSATAASAGTTKLGNSAKGAAGGVTALSTAARTGSTSLTAYGTAAAAAGTKADGATGKMSKLAGAVGRAGPLAFLALGSAVTSSGVQVENFGRSTAQLETDLFNAGSSASSLDNIFRDLQVGMSPDKTWSLAEGFRKLAGEGATVDRVMGNVSTVFGTFGTGATTNLQAVEQRLKTVGDSLGNMVRAGQGAQAEKIFSALATEANKAGISTERLKQLMPGYTSALAEAALQNRKLAQAAGDATGPVSELSQAINKIEGGRAALDIEGLGKAIKGLGSAAGNQTMANVQWGDSLREVSEALKESGGSVDQLSEKGGKAAAAQVRLAQSGVGLISTMVQNGASAGQVASKYMELRNSFIKANSGMKGGKAAAEQLANSLGLGIPNIKTAVAETQRLGPSAKTAAGGLSGLRTEVNAVGQVVATLDGKSITLPASVPNGHQVATTLLGIQGAAISLDGKSVTIPAKTLGAEGTALALTTISGARKDANGNVIIPTSALNAQNTKGLIDSIATSARLANGSAVVIPTSTPNAAAVAAALNGINAAAVSANGKSVTITAKAPLAPTVIAQLEKLEGVTVSADGKSVDIATSSKSAPDTVRKVRAITDAAVKAGAQKPNVQTSTNAPATRDKLGLTTRAAQSLGKQKPNVPTKTNALDSKGKLDKASKSASILGGYRPNVPTRTDAPATKGKLDSASKAANTLGGKRPNVGTRTDAPSTKSKLDSASSAANALGRKAPNVRTSTNADTTRGQVTSLLGSAQSKTISITTVFKTVGNIVKGIFSASGGPAVPGLTGYGPIHGFDPPGLAVGGTLVRDFRSGGRVSGPGTRTSDSVPARLTWGPSNLSDYEHVITGREVARSGGHGTWYLARDLARQGRLQKILAAGVRAGFAEGGTMTALGPTSRMGARSYAGLQQWRPSVTVAASRGPDYGREIAALRSEMRSLAARPVEVTSVAVLDGREVWRSTKRYQKQSERFGGRG